MQELIGISLEALLLYIYVAGIVYHVYRAIIKLKNNGHELQEILAQSGIETEITLKTLAVIVTFFWVISVALWPLMAVLKALKGKKKCN